jgi:hypothetical protein
MSVIDSEVRKKKLVVILVVVVLMAVLVAVVPAQKELWRVVRRLTPTATATPTAPAATPTVAAATAVAKVPTATPTVPAATPTVPAATATATATPVPPTATATATPVPPTATPTATASPTPTLDPSIVHPVPKGAMPVTDELEVPAITTPEGDVETTEAELAIGGRAPANARVVVYDNQFPLGMVIADETGQWQFEPPEPWAEAEHVIVARTTDGERISQPSDPVRVVVAGERLPITGRQAIAGESLSVSLARAAILVLIAAAALFAWRERE